MSAGNRGGGAPPVWAAAGATRKLGSQAAAAAPAEALSKRLRVIAALVARVVIPLRSPQESTAPLTIASRPCATNRLSQVTKSARTGVPTRRPRPAPSPGAVREA